MGQVDACPIGVHPLYYWREPIFPADFPQAKIPSFPSS